MRYEPNVAHTLSGQLTNRSGEPITSGTVDLYLLCTEDSGTAANVGKWYVNDDSFNASETAYASDHATHKGNGNWVDEVRYGAFVSGRKFRAYWLDSLGRNVPESKEVECEIGGTAIKTETASILEDTGTTLPSAISGITVDVDEAAVATAVVAAIAEDGVAVAAADTIGAFPTAALANSPATSPSVTITPAQISVSPGEAKSHATLYAYQYAKLSYTLTITDAAGTAIALTGKSLSMVFFDAAVPGVAVFTLATTGESGDNLAVSGDDGNIVTVTGADTHTQTARRLSWVLRNLTDDSVIGSGKLEIIACPA